MSILVEVNGSGSPAKKLGALGKQTVNSREGTGTALFNIRERLKGIWQRNAGIDQITSINEGGK